MTIVTNKISQLYMHGTVQIYMQCFIKAINELSLKMFKLRSKIIFFLRRRSKRIIWARTWLEHNLAFKILIWALTRFIDFCLACSISAQALLIHIWAHIWSWVKQAQLELSKGITKQALQFTHPIQYELTLVS